MGLGKTFSKLKNTRHVLKEEIKPEHDLHVKNGRFEDTLTWELREEHFKYFWRFMPKGEALEGMTFEQVALNGWSVPESVYKKTEKQLLKLAKMDAFQIQVNLRYPTWRILECSVKGLEFKKLGVGKYSASLKIQGVCVD